ncbi:MAG TPA: carbamoyltransferase HypF [Gemmatimonadales bacterium]
MSLTARLVRVRGVVQGVGFRPYIFRLAHAHAVNGWVLNAGDAVEIHVEGDAEQVASFLAGVGDDAPVAASIAAVDVSDATAVHLDDFTIHASRAREGQTAHVSPDLAICDECLAEVRDPSNRRFGYPYINCTGCGPRYSIVLSVPYDRSATTMRDWPMCARCQAEYDDPASRRFHAQPNACPDCGPAYRVWREGVASAGDPIAAVAAALRRGEIVAIKGIGGYHLACDAANAIAVAALRNRKFRKEKPFAVMACDLHRAGQIAELSAEAIRELASVARPIVLAPARMTFEGVAPANRELGVMLPSTPLHHLLFDAGAPDVLVMTSGNRSSEPIAIDDGEARRRLVDIADLFLIGDRPIARRMDDSVLGLRPAAVTMLRRSRGYAPGVVARLHTHGPLLALGGDLKNTVTLVAGGEAFTSQHIGDLEHVEAFGSFCHAVEDLLAMHGVRLDQLTVVTDAHPQYRSSAHAATLGSARVIAVQHHRAHLASVLAEREALDRDVIGVACDGTGYGDDGAIWGGELFAGSVTRGLERVGHLRSAPLVGGDAAAQLPVQCAAGFLAGMDDLPDFEAAPFWFPPRFRQAVTLSRQPTRVFRTTSVGRLFDAAAALLGYVTPITFEGEAAIWLEQLATLGVSGVAYPLPYTDGELDYRPLLAAVMRDRVAGVPSADIARAFHAGLARGLADAATMLARRRGVGVVVVSGGVFQNALLLGAMEQRLATAGLECWNNRVVPANDGGLSLGQAALAACQGGEAANA